MGTTAVTLFVGLVGALATVAIHLDVTSTTSGWSRRARWPVVIVPTLLLGGYLAVAAADDRFTWWFVPTSWWLLPTGMVSAALAEAAAAHVVSRVLVRATVRPQACDTVER